MTSTNGTIDDAATAESPLFAIANNGSSADSCSSKLPDVASGESADDCRRPTAAVPILPAASSELPLLAMAGPASSESPLSDPEGHGSPTDSRRLGSKGGAGVFQTIINQMPPHDVYIEPFAGWLVIMKAKRPAALNIGIDKNADRISEAENFFRLGNSADRIPRTAALGKTTDTIAEFRFDVDDGIEFLAKYEVPPFSRVLIYCDPPYMHETRAMDHKYLFEMSTVDHERLLDVLCGLSAMVMLSGYAAALYESKLRDWRLITFEAMTRGGYTKTEHLWCNFSEPIELHDYRFLGRDFRERQDIKRMKERWTRRLVTMPPLKRHALMQALRETQTIGSGRTADTRAVHPQSQAQSQPPTSGHNSSLEHSHF